MISQDLFENTVYRNTANPIRSLYLKENPQHFLLEPYQDQKEQAEPKGKIIKLALGTSPDACPIPHCGVPSESDEDASRRRQGEHEEELEERVGREGGSRLGGSGAVGARWCIV
ncbi:hypothetical protein GWI33_001188 [Rhynchophorus ferrugineus]|uniref:Uncharacterized protein n=1 Tax=Rhynchophorus ferrugineus TaxID=354439 RepID=A0A834LXG3_RHYFE|nr:hypothetical protein GWI33_001188 [Rhynchophorus ferrugineus]